MEHRETASLRFYDWFNTTEGRPVHVVWQGGMNVGRTRRGLGDGGWDGWRCYDSVVERWWTVGGDGWERLWRVRKLKRGSCGMKDDREASGLSAHNMELEGLGRGLRVGAEVAVRQIADGEVAVLPRSVNRKSRLWSGIAPIELWCVGCNAGERRLLGAAAGVDRRRWWARRREGPNAGEFGEPFARRASGGEYMCLWNEARSDSELGVALSRKSSVIEVSGRLVDIVFSGEVMGSGREIHGPNNSDHNDNTITNGDSIAVYCTSPVSSTDIP
ncbi:hypothetical protein Tco_0686333 [Tanacetum coccineum]